MFIYLSNLTDICDHRRPHGNEALFPFICFSGGAFVCFALTTCSLLTSWVTLCGFELTHNYEPYF